MWILRLETNDLDSYARMVVSLVSDQGRLTFVHYYLIVLLLDQAVKSSLIYSAVSTKFMASGTEWKLATASKVDMADVEKDWARLLLGNAADSDSDCVLIDEPNLHLGLSVLLVMASCCNQVGDRCHNFVASLPSTIQVTRLKTGSLCGHHNNTSRSM